MIRNSVIAITTVAFLGACAGPNGQGGISQRQGVGALAGAATGAALGTLVGGDDRRNALVGAGIGLLAGAAIGTYLDEQERQLQADLAGTGAEVKQVDGKLMVRLPERVSFDVDSAEVKPGMRKRLRRAARSLAENPSSYIDIVGHTDSTGPADYNQRLSERRASAVANILLRNGVQPQRVRAYGRGESEPIASNATPEGRARNRRVEIIITPAT